MCALFVGLCCSFEYVRCNEIKISLFFIYQKKKDGKILETWNYGLKKTERKKLFSTCVCFLFFNSSFMK